MNEIGKCTLKTVEQIKVDINLAKKEFVSKIKEIAELCDTPIEISIKERHHNNKFYRKDHPAFPFDLYVTLTTQKELFYPFVLGHQATKEAQERYLEQ